jgi:hypothetical protein
MPKLASYPDTLRLATLAAIAAATVSAPSAALAARPGHTIFDSTAVYWQCLAAGRKGCLKAYDLEDPPSIGVTSLTLSLKYDPSIFTFDPADSGPLGIYSVGGDAPPVAPGVGTQPFQELPSAGFTPGAPLPGSTLTYTDAGGLLTVDYDLASPITASDDVNYFLLAFDLVHPVPINFALSTVTYLETGPGADFTKTAFSCTTTTGVGCGSDVPTSGVTINFVGVPEPAAWALLVLGFAGLGAMLRARRAGALAV